MFVLKFFKNFIYYILDIISPRCCLFCGNELVNCSSFDGCSYKELFFCKSCQRDLLAIDQNDCCRRCGYPFQPFDVTDKYKSGKTNFLDNNRILCPSCKSIKLYFNIARSCYQYRTKLRRLLKNFKFFFQAEAIDFIGLSLLNTYSKMPKADIVCFIPIKKTKLFIKGYNHAALIANSFYKHLTKAGLHGQTILLYDLLLKIAYSKQSKMLSFKERWLKKHNFVVNDKYLSNDWKDFFKGKTILIIDDIMTTGSTLNAGSFLLKKAFSDIKVEGLTFARTMLY